MLSISNNFTIIQEFPTFYKAFKYPLFIDMINYLDGKESSKNYYYFCSIIKLLSSQTFDYLHRTLPILGRTSCYNHIFQLKHSLLNMIQNKEYVSLILELFYNKYIEYIDHKPKKQLLITLAGDAASIKPSFTSYNDAVYTFEALPLDGTLPPCAFHLMETRNGSSSPEVCSRFFTLSKQLKQIGYQVKFIATDGDISFDKFHYVFFNEKVVPLLDQPFMNIVHALINILEIPISDPFHLFKRARARLVDHLVLIDVDKLTCVNTQILLEITQLGEVLEDRSTAGAMKDAYSLALFSWETLISCLENGRFDSSFYLLPFVYLIEAILSPLPSKKKRLEFIEYSFALFKYHFIQISKVPENKYFKKRFRSPCLGVFFSDDIFLIRIMNTCIGLAISICLDIECLALQRVASHDVELFYGHMRMISFFNHTFENALRAAVEAIIIRKYSNEIGFPIQIRKRENIAGIILTSSINEQDDFVFDGHFINETIIRMLKSEIIDELKILLFTKMINSYTNRINNSNIKKLKKPHVMSGWNPALRYKTVNYAMSILPLPHRSSTFEYYLSKGKSKKTFKYLSRYSQFFCFRV